MKQFFSRFIRLGACLLALLTFISVARGGFLYVVHEANGPAARIYGYSVNETNGALTALAGFPVSYGGGGLGYSSSSEAITIDRKNRRLYAINSGSRRVAGFTINPVTGALTPMPFPPIFFTGGHYNSTVSIHPSGSPLVVGGGSVNHSWAYSFEITPTTATPSAGNPYPNGNNAFSSVFSRDGSVVYVGGSGSNGVFAYAVNQMTGALNPLPGSPYNYGSSPNGFETDQQGRLYMVSYFTPEVLVFTTDAQGVPVPVMGNPFASGLTRAVDGELHPNEQFYFAVDRQGNRIGVYRIDGAGAATTLAAVPGSPFPAMGEFTTSLVFNHSGKFLFVSNGDTRNLSTFNVNSETGFLTFNNVQPPNTFGNEGLLTGIAYLSPANSPVSGRVTDVNAVPIPRALVTATDELGNSYTALTNPFGYYRFDGLTIGAPYTFTVRHKPFGFLTQNYTINENMNELDFTVF